MEVGPGGVDTELHPKRRAFRHRPLELRQQLVLGDDLGGVANEELELRPGARRFLGGHRGGW
jgi:hypothetical protein